MATAKWESVKLYPPGSLVLPRTEAPATSTEITNPGFESGAADWTLGAGVAITGAQKFTGANSAGFSGTAGQVRILHDEVPCAAGKAITASCMYQQGAASSGQNIGRVVIRWLDAALALIREDEGTLITSSSGGWKKSTAAAKVGPAGTAYVQIGGLVNRTAAQASWMDTFAWDYAAQSVAAGLVYRAVQAATQYSGPTEPVWPLVLGVQVNDGLVIWEATQANRVTWEAEPIMLSGSVEPVWPTGLGQHIADNTVDWEAISRRVEDVNCPNSPIVQIDHSKVYMADDDIAPYSATNNPLDWTTENDAGYLPVNMNPFGGNPITAFGSYRSNMMIFNSQGMQNWQLDEDPALSALMDALPISCTENKSVAPAFNDLMLLNPLGVRSMGIAANSQNLKAGDVGMPVDSLILAAWKEVLALGIEPLGLYWPGSGQYWLIFKMHGEGPDFIDPDTLERTPFVWESQVFVYTVSQLGSVGAWSRYLFPFGIDYWTQDGATLVLRAGDLILEMDNDPNSTTVNDYVYNGGGERPAEFPAEQPFVGQVWWPWLDLGAPGVDKNLEYFDYTGEGSAILEIGYAQDTSKQTPGYFTEPYPLPPDTVTGDFIPFEVTAPSMSVRLTYNGGERWRLLTMALYLQGRR